MASASRRSWDCSASAEGARRGGRRAGTSQRCESGPAAGSKRLSLWKHAAFLTVENSHSLAAL